MQQAIRYSLLTLLVGFTLVGVGSIYDSKFSNNSKYVVATPNLMGDTGLGRVVSSGYHEDIDSCFIQLKQIVNIGKQGNDYLMKPIHERIFTCVKYGDLDY